MQLAVTAFAPLRCGVGDVLAAVRPCGIVTLRAEQRQKFVPVPGIAHTLIDHAHQLELPTLASVRRVVFCVGHSARMPLLVFLKFRQPQFLADLVIADAQLLNLFVRHVYLPAGFKIHAVDDAVRVNVFAVDVGADQNLTAVEVSGKSARCFVRRARVDVRTFREALHHVIKHHAAVLVVQQLRTQELVERSFRLTANTADERLSIPERLAELGNVAHDTFHAAACLRTNVSLWASTENYQEKKEFFYTWCKDKVLLSALESQERDSAEEEISDILSKLRKKSKYGVYLDITPPEVHNKGWKVVRTFFPELVQMCLPSFPYSNHPRMQEFGGIKNGLPHPVP